MTKKEMAMLADIISARVVDELLTVIKVRQNYDSLGWTSDSTGFEDLYKQYEDELGDHDLHQQDLAEDYLKNKSEEAKAKKSKPIKTKPTESEAKLVGELASLMTQKGMHLESEEYEKITAIVARIVVVKKLLKDNYNINMDLGIDDE